MRSATTETAPVKPKARGIKKIEVPNDGRSLTVQRDHLVEDARRAICDDYGELDRRMQIAKPDVQRYETLKHAIKSWFDQAPPDADGTIEGAAYRLHVSARERERRVRDVHALVEAIGLEKLLALVNIPLQRIEDLRGRVRLEEITVEARTGSRRIKAVPLRAAKENPRAGGAGG